MTWYADRDADGYGDLTTPTDACEAPDGTVADSTDCDDTIAGINPGAAEVCNYLDDDCEGTVDVGASDADTWYRDADGDGFGDPSNTTLTCDMPEGYIADASDCDDTSATVSPDGVEDCATEADDNCDGSLDAVDALNCGTFYNDGDADGYGGTDTQCSCAGLDTYTSTTSDDCDDADPDTYPGAPEIFGDGVSQGCDDAIDTLALSAADGIIHGDAASDYGGWGTAGVGDLDGDGQDDLLVGGYGSDAGATDAGGAFLFRGPIVGTLTLDLADASYLGARSSGSAGFSIAGRGDMDGDGLVDVFVAAPNAGTGGEIYLAPFLASGSMSLDDATTTLSGSSGETAGYSVAYAGDLDGDGNDDLLVGAPGNDSAGTDAGAAYVLTGPLTGSISLSSAAGTLTGRASNDYLGRAVAGVGDTNGDGMDDFLVGAYGDDGNGPDSGCAWLIEGPYTGTSQASLAYDAFLFGEFPNARAGVTVAGAGDIDGDGYADVLVGTPYSVADSEGRVYLQHGPMSGWTPMFQADTTFIGVDPQDMASAVTSLDDFDGDGQRDLLVGAGHTDGGGTDAGTAYLFLEVPDGSVDLDDADGTWSGATAEQAGDQVGDAGDLDGDGKSDAFVVGELDATEGSSAGAVYIVTGR